MYLVLTQLLLDPLNHLDLMKDELQEVRNMKISEDLAQTGDFLGAQIHGNSMAPRICDGDVEIVRQQADAENEEIVVEFIGTL